MVNDDLEDIEDFEMSTEELIKQPLNKKIENILPYILLHWTNRNFKKKWEWPIKNPKYGLYEDPPEPSNSELSSKIQKGIKNILFSKLKIKEIVADKKKQSIL